MGIHKKYQISDNVCFKSTIDSSQGIKEIYKIFIKYA